MFGFFLVVVFHILTRVLFPIGMFPYIMIVSALIFFEPTLHHTILKKISALIGVDKSHFDVKKVLTYSTSGWNKMKNGLLVAFFAIQLLLPHRFLLYPGDLFWTEQGFRFSWRVMLMEKAGYANFKILDGESGRRFYVDNTDFLTAQQEKMMSTQPDMIVEYAHYLGDHFTSEGHQNLEVYVESFVALNGERSRPYIDPSVDLLKVKDGLGHKEWILPLEN